MERIHGAVARGTYGNLANSTLPRSLCLDEATTVVNGASQDLGECSHAKPSSNLDVGGRLTNRTKSREIGILAAGDEMIDGILHRGEQGFLIIHQQSLLVTPENGVDERRPQTIDHVSPCELGSATHA